MEAGKASKRRYLSRRGWCTWPAAKMGARIVPAPGCRGTYLTPFTPLSPARSWPSAGRQAVNW